jgi:STE24 endopeptidase
MGVLEVPINYYRTFVIEEEFGFNKMTLTMFFADLVKQTFLGVLFGVPLLFGVLWLMGEMGANWWLYVWFMWMAFNLIILSIYPTWIAPLFNKFTPLDDASLKNVSSN